MAESSGATHTLGSEVERVRSTNDKKRKRSQIVQPLTKESLERFRETEKKKGVVYMSRIPPFMKPEKVRHLLSQFGEIGRIWLNPEDDKITKRRKKYKGKGKVNFTDGWVEFLDKKEAKWVAQHVNCTPVGGKRGNFHESDLWNIKYLKGFKWNDLTEQLAYEKNVREKRLRAELSQAKKEKDFYMEKVDTAKKMARYRERNERTESAAADESSSAKPDRNSKTSKSAISDARDTDEIRRRFRQRRAVKPTSDNASADIDQDLLAKVLA